MTAEPQASCHQVDSIARSHLVEIDRRIASLQALKGELTRMVDECGHGQSPVWLLAGIPALIAFAWLLTLAPADNAGRAYAAYGGIYIVASLLWLWLAESHVPDRWDLVGGGLAMAAAGTILFAPSL
eukprot:jgi/Tetstr1/452213/TSEL_039249.t1